MRQCAASSHDRPIKKGIERGNWQKTETLALSYNKFIEQNNIYCFAHYDPQGRLRDVACCFLATTIGSFGSIVTYPVGWYADFIAHLPQDSTESYVPTQGTDHFLRNPSAMQSIEPREDGKSWSSPPVLPSSTLTTVLLEKHLETRNVGQGMTTSLKEQVQEMAKADPPTYLTTREVTGRLYWDPITAA
jgi:hypothetical protein